jgi:hypothetical protein
MCQIIWWKLHASLLDIANFYLFEGMGKNSRQAASADATTRRLTDRHSLKRLGFPGLFYASLPMPLLGLRGFAGVGSALATTSGAPSLSRPDFASLSASTVNRGAAGVATAEGAPSSNPAASATS